MKRIAIIGAGPASYTLAGELVRSGNWHIEIFDQESEIGGAVHTGIPDFRMSKAFLKKTYDSLVEAGVVFHFNTKVDAEKFTELRNSFDEVVVAIGAQVENTFGFETGNGIVAGLTLLYDLNIRKKQDDYSIYHNAVVWGGGNVAMDCARSLKRIMDNVTIVYRRSLKEMPANQAEIRAAEKEGVKVAFLTNIKEINRDENGNVCSISAIEMELGEMDASGRASCHEKAGSEFVMDTDLVAMAIGQKVDFSVLDPQLKKTENHGSTLEHVWIVGDAWLGPSTISAAFLDGKALAKQLSE